MIEHAPDGKSWQEHFKTITSQQIKEIVQRFTDRVANYSEKFPFKGADRVAQRDLNFITIVAKAELAQRGDQPERRNQR